MAFAGPCLNGKDGRSGTGCTVHRTRREAKAHGFAQTAMQLALLMGLAYGIIVALFANPLVGFSGWRMRKH